MESDKYARHAKSEKYNEDFDKQLKETKVFTKELFEKFYDAYSYDTATTYSWVVKKLKILRDRLGQGNSLPIENRNRVLEHNNFLDWVEEEFPNTKKI